MKEKVDVLVATYNGEKYLREQLDSIIKQTYKNIRIFQKTEHKKYCKNMRKKIIE